MEKKLKHLEMLQGIIQRMATNSYTIKGWSIVLVSAIFALASGPMRFRVIYIAYLPALMFWILDGYFLRQERLFRKLYDKVRVTSEESIDFSMDTEPVVGQVKSWPGVMFSRTLLIFHGVIVLTITVAWLVALIRPNHLSHHF